MKTNFFVMLFAAAVLSVACGGTAKLGESCDTSGAADECESGGVCGKDKAGALKCLKVCAAQADCSSTEECNGVEGSSQKACRAK
jgi:hypothetical protein